MGAQATRPYKISYKKTLGAGTGSGARGSQDVLCSAVNLSPGSGLVRAGKARATPDLPREQKIARGDQALAVSRPHTQQLAVKPKSLRPAARLLDRRQEQPLAE